MSLRLVVIAALLTTLINVSFWLWLPRNTKPVSIFLTSKSTETQSVLGTDAQSVLPPTSNTNIASHDGKTTNIDSTLFIPTNLPESVVPTPTSNPKASLVSSTEEICLSYCVWDEYSANLTLAQLQFI